MKRFLTVDEFMKQGFDSDGSDEVQQEEKVKKGKKRKIEAKSGQVKKTKVKETVSLKTDKPDDSDSDSDGSYEDYSTTLANLEDKDPEFFKYLSENDRNLLDFNVSGDSDSGTEENDDHVKNEKIHKPPENLEVASDDSDYSDNEADRNEQERQSSKTMVTSKLIEEWRAQLQSKPKVSTLKTVMLAFRAAVEQASDEGNPSGPFVVKGPTVFNSTVRLCLSSLLPALHKVLGLPPPSQQLSGHEGPSLNPKKSKSWIRINTALRAYLSDIVKMLTVVVENDVVIVFLRHVLYWVPFYVQYPKHSRLLLKKLVSIWSTSEESVRVLAFLCMIRVLRILTSYLDYFLKQLYLSYVNNCKFTSPTSWPLINFMKRSLVELYSLDPSLAYQHAFVYIRQLAIHLRNAMTSKKKDAYQVVYNWQYVHCLLLWSHLLATLHSSDLLSGLVYPLVQVTLGVVNLIQTAKYLPLRFHLIRSLTVLSTETGTFIPILPLIIQIFDIVDFNKRHSSLSLKPMDLTCVLKLSKSQLQENAFRDGCVAQVYELLMDYLNATSHLISFPELVFPATAQMKKFLKTCKVGNYNRQIKQALDKVEENGKFVSDKRNSVPFGVSDVKAVDEWEQKLKKNGTPVTKFYVTWRKLKDQELLTAIAKKDQVKEPKLPTIDRKKLMENKKAEDQTEFAELFENVSDDDAEMFSRAIQKSDRMEEKRKLSKKKLKNK